MIRVSLVVAMVAILNFPTFGIAQNSGKHNSAEVQDLPNGCGTGWNKYLVPNSVPILQCQFLDACNSHDVCYGRCTTSSTGECAYLRCQKGGDLFNSPQCLSSAELVYSIASARKRRQQCDNALYGDIVKLNNGKTVCTLFATVYRDAVKNFGANAFAGIEDVKSGVRQSESDYNLQIRELFLIGTEDEFNKTYLRLESNGGGLKLNRPLKYVKGEGLLNK
jgi:hypothetical protein